MPMVPFLKGKTVAVMGLGKSGTATARALSDSGAVVWAWDDKPETRAAAQAAGLPVVDPLTADLGQAALLVWSPGVPHTKPAPHPLAELARRLGVKLVCDIELLALACPTARFVGITGTNGKSTTTTLIAHLLRSAGHAVAAGGNLGTPALDLPALGADGTYVLELSSYQLELIDQARFDVGVLLNISPDHLTRHGGMDGYVAAKARLFRHLRPQGAAVIGVDDDEARGLFDDLKKAAGTRVLPISSTRRLAHGMSAPDGVLLAGGTGETLADLRPIATLPGRHNWQNACAAAAAVRALGIDAAAIAGGLASYPGLAHRQELVARIDGVAYVNDSKATNADAAEKAMVCYDHIYWIVGGQAKEGGITGLGPLFPRVRHAFLIGEAAEDFAATLAGQVPFSHCRTLDVAVAEARRAALADGKPGAVVLLSPACASWDQFTSFEHRGETFRRLVAGLPGERSGA